MDGTRQDHGEEPISLRQLMCTPVVFVVFVFCMRVSFWKATLLGDNGKIRELLLKGARAL